MAKIVMIGTYHLDPDGEERLTERLTEIAPDIVICEGRPEKQLGYESKIEMFRQRLPASGLSRSRQRKLLDLELRPNFEERGSRKFCETKGIPFFWFGDSCKELTEQEGEEQVRLTIEKCKTLNPDHIIEALRQGANRQYTGLKNAMDTTLEPFIFLQEGYYASIVEEGFGPRDREMEDFLRPKLAKYPNATIATVNGFNHILRDPQGLSLYCRIRNLNPQRRLWYSV